MDLKTVHFNPFRTFQFCTFDRQRKAVQFKLDPTLLDVSSVPFIIVLVEVLTDLDIADIIIDDHAEIIFETLVVCGLNHDPLKFLF